MNSSTKTFFLSFFFLIFSFSIIGQTEPKTDCKSPLLNQTESFSSSYLLSQGLVRQIAAFQKIREGDKKSAHSLNNEAVAFFQSYRDCLATSGKKPGVYSLFFQANSYYEMGAWIEAEKTVDLAIAEDPALRDAYLLKTRILIRQTKYQNAINFMEANMNRFADDSDFLFLLGSLNMETGNDNAALLHFISLYDSMKNREGDLKYRTYVLKNLGELYYRSGDNRKAAFYYKLYLQYVDKISDRLKLVKLYSLLGNFNLAKMELQQILEKHPNRSDVYELLAEIIYIENKNESYHFLQKFREKIRKTSLASRIAKLQNGFGHTVSEDIKKFIDKYPNRLAARVAYLQILENQKQWDIFPDQVKNASELAYNFRLYSLSARMAYNLLEHSEQHPEWKLEKSRINDFIGGCFEDEGHPYQAILYVKKAVQLETNEKNRDKFKLHLSYLYRHESVRQYDESLRIAASVIAKDPANAYAYFLSGIVNYEKKELQTSIKQIEKAISLEAKNPVYNFYLALANDAANNMEPTIQALRQAIAHDAKYAGAYNYLGYFLLSKKNDNYTAALELIKKAVELEPDNPAFQDSLGWAYFKLNDLKKARYHLLLALQVMSETGNIDPVVLDHLGDLYQKENDLVNAGEFWEKSFQLHVDDKEKAIIRKKIQSVK